MPETKRTVRAKFYLAEKRETTYGNTLVFKAVSKHGPHDPADNEAFWSATPIGELTIQLSKDAGRDAWANYGDAMGRDFYIDIIDAEGVVGPKCMPRWDGEAKVYHHAEHCPEYVEGGTPLKA